MAHEYVMNYMASPDCKDTTVSNIVSVAWSYADLMQDEANKREKKEVEEESKNSREVRQKFINTFEKHKLCCSEEWQPDWSQAPSRMNYYFMNRDGGEYWTVNKPDEPNMTEHVMDFRDCGGDCYAYASSQNYQGKWHESLRKRPQ